MTETIISLVSILCGILGALVLGYIQKSYSFGFTGNIIIGVFSSILIIKTLGRLGFNPNYIIKNQQIHYLLLFLNLFVSFISGALGLILANRFKKNNI